MQDRTLDPLTYETSQDVVFIIQGFQQFLSMIILSVSNICNKTHTPKNIIKLDKSSDKEDLPNQLTFISNMNHTKFILSLIVISKQLRAIHSTGTWR